VTSLPQTGSRRSDPPLGAAQRGDPGFGRGGVG
jgi:hypothetical protein